ncbi:protein DETOXIFICATION 44, chloroplastic-like isoform X2 [Nymphaea colorata]|uniref:protein DETOXIFICATION 44, chloroplastic-like isoform X2 n=1 Tax=Nymphaea colorata TaxID=210225 RepID=UPI00129E485E|nr:protein DETOXIFICATION 44, chloroplastic-like isoform X2 [Nymphaea colorata]
MAAIVPHLVQCFHPPQQRRRTCSFYSPVRLHKFPNPSRRDTKLVADTLPVRAKSSPKNDTVNSRTRQKASVSKEAEKGRGWVSTIMQGLSFSELVKDQLVLDILAIALPALLALAADPVTSLVDTAFIGHLGSAELAGVGVSISVFNLVSKLFNIPLLNITTSFVAEEEVLVGNAENASPTGEITKRVLPSVSASLVLAAGLGIAEAIALSIGSGYFLNIMGIPADSPMHLPAEQFLALRGLGAPAVVIALAAQGSFRGFKDTKTPLYAIGAGNLLNAVLDPILMFTFNLGVGGAAIATVMSEYVIALILLWELNSRVMLIPPKLQMIQLDRFINSGRTIAVLSTFTLGTSMAARQGPIPMAAHQICLQIWLAVSLLNDSLALSGQALLAGAYSQGDYKQARLIIHRVLQIGLLTGIGLSILLYLCFGIFVELFTTDSSVLEIVRSGVLFVAGSQPINALAFVFDGIYYGVSDFNYAAYSMVLVGFTSSLFLFLGAHAFGLAGVWAGLFLFMSLRLAAGIWRLSTQAGPWKMLPTEVDIEIVD